jgi:hypothetical protein
MSKVVMELNCTPLGKTSLSDSFTVRVVKTNNIDEVEVEASSILSIVKKK